MCYFKLINTVLKSDIMLPKKKCLRNSKIALKFQWAKRICIIDQNVQNIVLINNKNRLGLQKSYAIFEFLRQFAWLCKHHFSKQCWSF